MAKTKRGPALFELLEANGGRSAGVKVPSWWSRHEQELPDVPAMEAKGVIGESAYSGISPNESNEVQNGHWPSIEVEGDRIRISLTSVTAAVAVFVGLGVVFASYVIGTQRGDAAGFQRGFQAGRVDAGSGTADEIESLRKQSPASHLVGSLLEDAGRKTSSGPGQREDRTPAKTSTAIVPNATGQVGAAAGWVRNLTYIVAQEFTAANIEKARHAREFLAQRGVNSELVPFGNETSMLIVTQGYDHKDPAQKRLADQLLEKVRAIGTQYYSAGGGYRLEGYYKTLKRDSW